MGKMRKKGKFLFKYKNTIFLSIVAILAISIVAYASLFRQSNESGIEELSAELFPEKGFKTKIILGDTIPKLVESGAIDFDKIKQIYGNRLTDAHLKLLTQPNYEPLTLTPENANFLLTVLWPLGISNKNPILDEMENYESVANLASTGGWPLGKEDAMVYFNKIEIIKLTPEQQANLEEVAQNTFRPCCNNPTSFPDCNHGAALLALLELGASQGMGKDELYKLALQANTLWFPQQYLATATYLKSQGKDYWSSAKEIMSFKYSSVSGWINNVYKPLQEQGGLPQARGAAACGI